VDDILVLLTSTSNVGYERGRQRLLLAPHRAMRVCSPYSSGSSWLIYVMGAKELS